MCSIRAGCPSRNDRLAILCKFFTNHIEDSPHDLARKMEMTPFREKFGYH